MKSRTSSKNKMLKVKGTSEILAFHVLLTRSYFQRLVGLIGKKSFERHKVLWIYPCKGIHTFFMSFPIDVLFVDRFLKIEAIYENVKPWNCIPSIKNGFSVFEFYGGVLKEKKIKIGDQLSVVS